MEGPDAGSPVVALPERVDRRVRLGPFPSARDALKFVCYAAAGAVLAPFASPFAWIPVLVAGFAVCVWRPDGEAVDERGARWLLFWGHRVVGRALTPRRPSAPVRGPVAQLAGGRRATVVRTGGTPLAYRPPAELASLFERFRDLLRASEGPIVLRSTTVPLRDGPVLPKDSPCLAVEAAARAGYRELVSVLCRRRRSRRVEISLSSAEAGPEGERRLQERATGLTELLAALGLRPTILVDRSLSDALRGYGWTVVGVPP